MIQNFDHINASTHTHTHDRREATKSGRRSDRRCVLRAHSSIVSSSTYRVHMMMSTTFRFERAQLGGDGGGGCSEPASKRVARRIKSSRIERQQREWAATQRVQMVAAAAAHVAVLFFSRALRLFCSHRVVETAAGATAATTTTARCVIQNGVATQRPLSPYVGGGSVGVVDAPILPLPTIDGDSGTLWFVKARRVRHLRAFILSSSCSVVCPKFWFLRQQNKSDDERQLMEVQVEQATGCCRDSTNKNLSNNLFSLAVKLEEAAM